MSVSVCNPLTREKHGVFVRSFLHVVWFTSQRALINLEVVALYQNSISRKQVTFQRKEGSPSVHHATSDRIPLSGRTAISLHPFFHSLIKTNTSWNTLNLTYFTTTCVAGGMKINIWQESEYIHIGGPKQQLFFKCFASIPDGYTFLTGMNFCTWTLKVPFEETQL